MQLHLTEIEMMELLNVYKLERGTTIDHRKTYYYTMKEALHKKGYYLVSAFPDSLGEVEYIIDTIESLYPERKCL